MIGRHGKALELLMSAVMGLQFRRAKSRTGQNYRCCAPEFFWPLHWPQAPPRPRSGFLESPVTSRNIDLSPDGERLLGVTTGAADAPFMQIVLNWFEELNRLAP